MPRITSLVEETAVEIHGEILTAMTKDLPKFTELTEALDYHNCGLNDIAQTVGNVMKMGSSDQVRLAAARLASELRGVAKGKDSNTFNFIISDTNGVNLMNIFNPER